LKILSLGYTDKQPNFPAEQSPHITAMPLVLVDTPMVEIFAKYQTFFVGVLGFTGVIITMVVNAKTQRDLQSRQRQHDAQSVRTALRAELKANAEMYEARIKDFSASGGIHHAIVPSKVVNTIYQTVLPKHWITFYGRSGIGYSGVLVVGRIALPAKNPRRNG
jgi:hypothetical protein